MLLDRSILYCAVQIHVEILNADQQVIRTKDATGFFLSFGPNELVLITNRHVVDHTWEPPGKYNPRFHATTSKVRYYGRLKSDNLKTEFELASSAFVFPSDYRSDVAMVHVTHAKTSTGQPLIVDNFIRLSDLSQPDEYGNGINLADEVAFVGYTEWNSQLYDRPMLRTGRIVADPGFELNFPLVQGDALLVEGFSTKGMSGSPLFALQRGLDFEVQPPLVANDPSFRPFRLIGVSAGYLGSPDHQHAQLSYAFKTGPIWECARRLFGNF